jgi:hypothetical protein
MATLAKVARMSGAKSGTSVQATGRSRISLRSSGLRLLPTMSMRQGRRPLHHSHGWKMARCGARAMGESIPPMQTASAQSAMSVAGSKRRGKRTETSA